MKRTTKAPAQAGALARKASAQAEAQARKASAPAEAQARKASADAGAKALKASQKAKVRKAPKASEPDHSLIDWRTFAPAPIIGVDEVGRGCLAGPVYAAAVSFNSDILCELVTDSKLLSEARREELFAEILKHHQVGIGFASVEEIDEINILQASMLAMRRAIKKLGVSSGHILVDGHMKIPRMSKAFTQTPVVKGDLRVALISAASIVAKVTRDQWMKDLARKYPQYGFELHKGYGTSFHQESLAQHGPCKLHRRTFSGVKEYFAL